MLFRSEPFSNRVPRKDCFSCAKEFKGNKEMNYCQFCGNANCADCSKRTRCFYGEEGSKVRGVCCGMCTSKFHIAKLMAGSFRGIDATNLTLKAMEKRCETEQDAIKKDKERQDMELQ